MKDIPNIEDVFALARPLIRAIAGALGPQCEIVLHDMRTLEHSIIAIENGHITGRQVGDSSTNLGLQVVSEPEQDGDILNYRAKSRDGKTLKSSSLYLYDQTGQAVGAICINCDITELELAANVLNRFVRTERQVEETFSGDIGDVIEALLEQGLALVDKPVAYMHKADKLKLLQFLDSKGTFNVKRSMDRVAQFLGVSKFTVYNYLEEVRGQKDGLP
ncbi:PAS domain-containing protein [Paenibacillus sp. IB182496]|uniref:PAS domain-containing protein n=1 Tax=Paenibacillus sabuli TaxID=2772509 RepID=A0A927BSM3_9BACL|nr:PAS domain-containing protein [Paenibacillus sabuli]MBD2844804.1 PAS domain-containing protein [Paenibacillus sabuli]